MDTELPQEEPVIEPIDASLRIIYRTPTGGVAVVVPVVDCGLTIEKIASRSVPEGAEWKIVDVSAIPTDRSFRNAWEYFSE